MNRTLSDNLSRRRWCPQRLASKRMAGVTLIELMMTISLVAITLAIAVPSYKNFTNANRLAGEVNALLGDMQFARGEAIKEGQTVVICSSADGATCSGKTTWNIGWIVFSDVNNNGVVDTGETVFRVKNGFNSTDSFNADNATSAVTFNREGFAPVGNIVTITLHDSTADPQWTRCMKINIVGMLMTTRYSTPATPTWPGPCT